jgi:parvulin-like peptidyl-prolyl isomerase
VSPGKGRRGTSGKGGGGGASGPAATRRLGLVVFGAAFVALFLIVAISEGVGDPSIPSGDVILVKDAPGDIGHVSKADLEHTIEFTSAAGKTPKPGNPEYEKAKEEAEKFILEGIWIQGFSDELGIEVTDQEIAKKLKESEEGFKSKAEFQKAIKEAHLTPADIHSRLKIELLTEQLRAKLKEQSPKPSSDEVKAYYEAAKATQFTQKPTRDVRLVVNKDKKKAEEAFDALSTDNTAGNWAKTAKKYSEDPATKESGGLQKAVQEGVLEEPLNAEVFGTPEGQVEGPVPAPRGYTVFEVVNSTPESVQELKTVEAQIKATLEQQLEREYGENYIANSFIAKWTPRTFCASGYVIERCANFKPSGHPSTAEPGCYEADPKGGLPEACPAPVFQATPAAPGTVTPLEPKGKALPQRPVLIEEEKEEGATGLEGLPEGAVPPTEAAPPAEEAPPAEGE